MYNLCFLSYVDIVVMSENGRKNVFVFLILIYLDKVVYFVNAQLSDS